MKSTLTSGNARFSEPSALPHPLHQDAPVPVICSYEHIESLSPDLVSLAQTAQSLLDYKLAESTQSVYGRDWNLFYDWCATHELDALHASESVLALYATDMAERGLKLPTIRRRMAAIRTAHIKAGLASSADSSLVRDILRGISRRDGMAPVGVKALLTDDIRRIVEAIPANSVIGIRNRAIILLGFAGAFRRSELVRLDIDDLQDDTNGLIIHLRKSKTDQHGRGRLVGIPKGTHQMTCPVTALQRWREASDITEGPLFRSISRYGIISPSRLSDRAIALIVKQTTAAAGLDATHYSGHSLRAGHCTQAARQGISETVIMQQTGHRTRSTLQRYIRIGTIFIENSAEALGL